jgi:hypothetical protein
MGHLSNRKAGIGQELLGEQQAVRLGELDQRNAQFPADNAPHLTRPEAQTAGQRV